MINVFDRVLKIIARDYAGRFLELAFPGENVRITETAENVELSVPEQRVDFVHKFIYNEQQYLLHFEFQLEHRADLPKRLFIYSALLTLQFSLPVVSLLLLLERRAGEFPNDYIVRVGNRVTNLFRYQVLKLWDYEEAIKAGRLREFAPLLIMLSEKRDEEILGLEKDLILREGDPKKRADLLAAAVAIASRYFEKSFLWKFFREEVEQMRQATFIEEWIEEAVKEAVEKAVKEARKEAIKEGIKEGMKEGIKEGIKEGMKEGMKEGKKEGIRLMLERIITHKFGQAPDGILEKLSSLNLEQLEQLLEPALQASDPDAFMESIESVRER